MKIFLAFPFSGIINEENNIIADYYIGFLTGIRQAILDKNMKVFLAHFRENWGKSLMTAEECTPLDLIEMQESDFVFAFPGPPISGGVHIELGWASALGKKIVLFLKRGEEYSPLIVGISTITEAEVVYFDDITDDIIYDTIINKINSLAQLCSY